MYKSIYIIYLSENMLLAGQYYKFFIKNKFIGDYINYKIVRVCQVR